MSSEFDREPRSISESIKEKNPYKRGADDGVILGLILIILFLAMTFSLKYPLANLLGLLLFFVGVPMTTFFLLRRSYIRDNGLTLFSSLWMQGIVMFFCATLILALFTYVYLRFLNPSFMVDMLNTAAAHYENLGTARGHQTADIMHAMIHQNLVPSAISMAIETIWVGVFTGSLLSALVAGIVRMKFWKNN